MDTEYMIKEANWQMQNTLYLGEAFPLLNPNLGPDYFAAGYGAELEYGESTSWAKHFLTDEDVENYQGFQLEMQNKYYAKMDEMTKAAVEDGIVAGGGTALINAIPAVEKLIPTLDGDERTGAKIVLKALEEPVRQIAANAGLDGSVIIDKIRRSRKVVYGFDAYNEEYVDMLSAGIVDPTKVTRSALMNAASCASMVLTTESLVGNKKEDNPPAPAAPGGMGGMY